MRTLRSILVVCSALLTLSASSARAHTNLKPGFNLFSTSQDVEIGKTSAAQAEKQLPMLNSPATTRLVDRIGQRLAAQAGTPHFPYRFKVVNLSDLNAFALPGGFIYVYRGLVERARTEGELAGVMAHEIAHVALRHPTRQATKAYAANAGVGLLGSLFGGQSGGRTSQVINALGGFGLNSMFLKFSRTAEAEADAYGAQIMSRAGYDPMEMANFFAFMRQESGRDPSRVAVFLSSHPSAADRETHIRSEARAMGSPGRVELVGGLPTAQAELRRLAPAPRMSQLTRSTGSVGLR